MEGIFFSRRTVGSFFSPDFTEGKAYITSAQDNICAGEHQRCATVLIAGFNVSAMLN